MLNKNENLKRRSARTRFKIKSLSKNEKLRLSVFRSNFHIYAQIIDDVKGITLFSASSRDNDIKVELIKGWDCKAAEIIGQIVANKAISNGIKTVVFDRGPYPYHGRIKALAMGARAAGLEF